jgi:hypothetical protein
MPFSFKQAYIKEKEYSATLTTEICDLLALVREQAAKIKEYEADIKKPTKTTNRTQH